MEINVGSSVRKAYLDVPVVPLNNTMNVTVKRGDLVQELNTVMQESVGRYSVNLPFKFVEYDALVSIEWEFEYEEESQVHEFYAKTFVDVVTPYLSALELSTVLNHEGFSPTESSSAEQAMRHVINAFTGQAFGNFVGTKNVYSRGGKFLYLPERLRSLSSVDGLTNQNYFLTSGGFALKRHAFGVPPVKADYDGYHQHVGGVIHNPNNVPHIHGFANRDYEITGEWGYSFVPQPVKEAAVLILQDYTDPDSQYRDRYLVSMTAADWRVQLNGEAYAGTGNARADQLLTPYIMKTGWAVF